MNFFGRKRWIIVEPDSLAWDDGGTSNGVIQGFSLIR
jgi:hypothetical protein